jgi:hypothetical protein
MAVTVMGPSATQTVILKDTVSTNYGNLDGVTLCQVSRTTTLVSISKTWLTVGTTTGVVTVTSTNSSDSSGSPYTVIVKQCLTNYPTICSNNHTIIVTITACVVTSITKSNAGSYTGVTTTYVMGSAMQTLNVPTYV